jgi:cyclophilin family peptidyl-prolyl cis-trans isomerase
MNQTTWIVGGGILIVVLAGVLFTLSGDDAKLTIDTSSNKNNDLTITRIDTATSSASDDSADIALTTMPDKTNNESAKTSVAPSAQVAAVAASAKDMVTLKTSMGDITVKLYTKEVPKASENFMKLASSGFYDGVKFHRVIKGFMIQGGDPNSKDDALMNRWGAGGPGYQFADEIDTTSEIYKRGYKHGVLAMANSGPNTNGSQFFIMAADYPLPPLYVIFGEVVDGLDVVDAIDAVKTDGNDRPIAPVTITSAKVR